MITVKRFGFAYSTTQQSSDTTVNMYWEMVNNRYINIYNKISYAYDVEWIDGCIHDAEYGIHHCQYIKNTALRSVYIQQFTFICEHLNRIKQGLTS